MNGTLEARKGLARCGSLIGEIRRSRGMSREDLAMLAGMHVNTIANMERGDVASSFMAVSLAFVFLDCPSVHVAPEGLVPLPGPGGRVPARPPGPAYVSAMTGKRFRERRLETGMSLEDLSRRAGLHRNTLWAMERGLVVPSIATVHRILGALGVSRVDGHGNDISLH